MQQTQHVQRRCDDAHEPPSTARGRQADRFEVFTAACEAEDICPIWMADRLADREQASS